MKEQLYIIKIGGNCIDDKSVLLPFLSTFSAIQGKKILIHGGGSIATKHAQLLNAEITSKLQSMNCNAIGLCGADAGLIKATKRLVNDIDFGFVGDIDEDSINVDIFRHLLEFPLIPIIAPITYDRFGNLLNTNADTIATMIAIALQKTYDITLIYCFDKSGVLSNPAKEESMLVSLNKAEYDELKNQCMIHNGMIPKLDNAFLALNSGVNTIFLTSPDSLKSNCMVIKGTRIIS